MGIGWERENRAHFDEIVDTYDRIRPEYPAELVRDMDDYVGAANGKQALEIGAGTGKATKRLIEAGYDVTAVEVGENMVAFLQRRFGGCGRFAAIHDAFETAPLKEGSFDLIYAASAFHWVDAQIGCPKALRLLRPGGTFALFRYNAPPPDGEPLYEDIQAVYHRHYHKPYIRPRPMTLEDYTSPAAIYKGFRFSDMAEYGFVDVTMKFYEVVRSFDVEEYMSLLDTFADHRSLPDADREALYAGIREAILRHGGRISVDYLFQLYMGRAS